MYIHTHIPKGENVQGKAKSNKSSLFFYIAWPLLCPKPPKVHGHKFQSCWDTQSCAMNDTEEIHTETGEEQEHTAILIRNTSGQ